jgi:hypothetical protein
LNEKLKKIEEKGLKKTLSGQNNTDLFTLLPDGGILKKTRHENLDLMPQAIQRPQINPLLY